MAGGLRFRAEATPFGAAATNFTPATKTFAVGTIVIVPAASLTGIQRPGIYRVALGAVAAATFQFQDTSGGILSALFTIPTGGFFIIGDGAVNGDPLWQPAAQGLGIQIVVGTAAITGDIWTALGG